VRSGPSTGTIVAATLIAFGAGLALGAWLNRDYNWHGRGIYYHGWSGIGWIRHRVHTSTCKNRYYINNNYRTVTVNRTIVNRNITTYRTNVHTRAINIIATSMSAGRPRTYTPATGVNSHRALNRSNNNVPSRNVQPTRTNRNQRRIDPNSNFEHQPFIDRQIKRQQVRFEWEPYQLRPSSSPPPRRSSSGGSSKSSGKSSGSGKSKGH